MRLRNPSVIAADGQFRRRRPDVLIGAGLPEGTVSPSWSLERNSENQILKMARVWVSGLSIRAVARPSGLHCFFVAQGKKH